MSPLLLHGSTNQYNINGLLCIYTEMFRIQTCCNYILSAAEGFRGRKQHARIQGFLSVLFSPQLILQFTEGVGPMVLLLKKQILYFTKDPEGVHYFPGGGVSNFFQGGGVQMLIFRGCPDPLSPSGSAHGQCHHNGTIFITVPLLTIIVRH